MTSVGYLGPIGTHTFEALTSFFHQQHIECSPRPYSTISRLFDSLKAEEVKSIFIPIENSIGGEVVSSLDCLMDLDDTFSIQAEFSTPIYQSLMAKSSIKDLSTITDIFAHEQSIHQSRTFLNQFCSDAQLHFCSSNAQAAEIVSKQDFEFMDNNSHITACIGSRSCVDLYHLNLLKDDVNDVSTNKTRFLFISKDNLFPFQKHKTSFVFSTKKDTPGSLCDILLELSNNNVNMARIVSRPTKKRLGEYMFFVDIEGSITDSLIDQVLDNIKSKCLWFKLLGSYYSGDNNA